ncbi:hypothetical protein, partial [Salmonella sp. s54395]|uniref:hypothetical protein n=1 Tax=Salmonella sp. s54395 TaxID=3159664 RepID=UPI00398066AA
MFARLRERSEQFVLDENTAKLPKQKPPTVKSTELPVNSTLAQTSNDVSLSYIASQSQQQTDSRQPQWTKKTPPWEAQRKKRP